jgi:hypothetical protein
MQNKDLTYSEAIEQVMLNNWFYAPLKLIYKEIWNYKDKSKIVGKTPDMTVQERVQRDKRFTKIWLWIYALTEYLDKLPKEVEIKNEKDEVKRMHTHIQGMLIEIWNMNWYDTYTPDKNWIFINRELWKIATIDKVPPFTYEKIISSSIKFVDVIWFNERWFPAKLIEVENSTDFRAWFIKFNEIQDFRTSFLFIAPEERKAKFDTERTKSAFQNIKDRCFFESYDFVEKWYKNQIEWKAFKNLS